MKYLLLFFLCVPAFASEFCALTVSVVDVHGNPVSRRSELVDSQGNIVESAVTDHGTVKFCDIGFGEYSIRIGDGCGSLTLNHVRFVFGVSQRFHVVANECLAGGDGGSFPPHCILYLRVSSATGMKLAQAEATPTDGDITFPADLYGRIFIALPSGGSKTFRVTAPYYRSQVVKASCREYEMIESAAQLLPE